MDKLDTSTAENKDEKDARHGTGTCQQFSCVSVWGSDEEANGDRLGEESTLVWGMESGRQTMLPQEAKQQLHAPSLPRGKV